MLLTKYSCQGNDFVLFDSMTQEHAGLELSAKQVAFLCDRRMGVGADGLLVLKESKTLDFRMVYYNADGQEVEMCGNGARACVHAFSLSRKLPLETRVDFETMNGLYSGRLHQNNEVSVSMSEVGHIDTQLTSDLNRHMRAKKSFYVQVGVPHTLFEVEDVKNLELKALAPLVRKDPRFTAGTNVSIFSLHSNAEIDMRTFERGVEGETLACGTAATALAYIAEQIYQRGMPQQINVQGGVLKVESREKSYQLRGSVSDVFQAVLCRASQAHLRELQ